MSQTNQKPLTNPNTVDMVTVRQKPVYEGEEWKALSILTHIDHRDDLPGGGEVAHIDPSFLPKHF